MPRVTMIGGPNGAGKTLFVSEYLAMTVDDLAYVNADEIARALTAAHHTASIEARAAREMLSQIADLTRAGASLVVETTLASLSYARKIPEWRRIGYYVALIYLRLPTVEHSVERVRRRVAEGGHGIPEGVIRRRYAKSLLYLESHYMPIVDEWEIWDSLEGEFRRAQTSESGWAST